LSSPSPGCCVANTLGQTGRRELTLEWIFGEGRTVASVPPTAWLDDGTLAILERPHLRPYFYENKAWTDGDIASRDEVKAMAELLLSNFASAIIHSAAFPQYPLRGVEQTIRFHLRNSPAMRDFLLEGFDRFQLAGLALLCLKNQTKAETETDLRGLIRVAGLDQCERVPRERLLNHLQATDEAEPLELAKYSLEPAR
jgi:hypothetical protein